MKVFINRLRIGFSGGMIAVAANSKEHAHQIFHNQARNFNLDYQFAQNPDGSFCDFYYKAADWEQLRGIYAKGNPRILAEDHWSG